MRLVTTHESSIGSKSPPRSGKHPTRECRGGVYPSAMSQSPRFVLAGCLLTTTIAGCERLPSPNQNSTELQSSGSCEDAGCGNGARCIEEMCVPDPCFEAASPRPPFGETGILVDMRTLVVTSGRTAQQFLANTDDVLEAPAAEELVPHSRRIVATQPMGAVTSGPIIYENVVSAAVGDVRRSELTLYTQEVPTRTVELPLSPVLLASGDFDGVGLHELLVSDGKSLLLWSDGGQALPRKLPRPAAAVGVGLIDDDVLSDAVFVAGAHLVIYHGGADAFTSTHLPATALSVAAFRRDGRPSDTLAVAFGDVVRFYELDEEEGLREQAAVELAADALVTTKTVSGRDVLGVLHGERVSAYLIGSGAKSELLLTHAGSASVSNPSGLYSADFPGATVLVRRIAQQRTGGYLVPQYLLVHPPHWRGFQGAGEVAIGDQSDVGTGTRTQTESGTASILGTTSGKEFGLGAKVEINASGPVSPFLGVTVVAGAYDKFKETTTLTQSTYESFRSDSKTKVRQQFLVEVPDELQGRPPAHVVAFGRCLDEYEFRVHDVQGLVSEELGDTIVMSYPVDSLTEVMELSRYNAIARRTGGASITVPHVAGDPTSYPSEMRTLDGDLVSSDDVFFAPTERYLTQGAQVAWRREFEKREYQEVGDKAKRATSSVHESGSYLKTKVEAGVKAKGFAEVKALAVLEGKTTEGTISGDGESALEASAGTTFYGERDLITGILHPIEEDPSTPEDETVQLRFTIAPYVYKHTAVSAEGARFEFLVVDYVVGGL